jgi:hypothetical protein
VTDRVRAATPEREQAQDPERKGIVVLIDLERIVAQSEAGSELCDGAQSQRQDSVRSAAGVILIPDPK